MIQKLIRSHIVLRMYFLKSLPMALMAGLKVRKLENNSCTVSIPYKHLNKNPFQSMYFAAQSMAAELSTALLAMQNIQESGEKISMLVTNMEAQFVKKATKRVYFTCDDGALIKETVQRAQVSKNGESFIAKTIGIDELGVKVSEFHFTWSIKLKT